MRDSMAESIFTGGGEGDFTGRDKELSSVAEAFINTILTINGYEEEGLSRRDAQRKSQYLTKVVLVSGGPLVGKTQFAREAAARLQTLATHQDIHLNVHSCELQGLNDPYLLRVQIASSLLPWQQGILEDFQGGLEALEEWHLFVLDGADVFGGNDLQSGFMALCQEVVTLSSQILLMMTSRWTFTFLRMMKQVLQVCLNPLTPDESRRLLFSGLEQRPQQSTQDFGAQECIDDIIEHCGGIPFALQLVRADLRKKDRSLADILADLRSGKHADKKRNVDEEYDDDYDRRADGGVDSDSESATHYSKKARNILEPLMEGAINSLSPILKKYFAMLVYNPSSFSAEAAAHLTALNPTSNAKHRVLLPLHMRSLIAVDTLSDRFNILSFLRHHVEERYSLFISPSETCIIRGRYCSFYARLLLRAADLLEKDDACKSIPIFTVELQNMQKLLQEAIHCPEESYDLFLEVAFQARQLILQFIPNHDAITFYQACLQAAERRKDKQRQARILISLGRLVRYVDGDMQYAEDVYRQALNLLAPSGDGLDHAATLSVLGFHFFDSAQPKLAISYLQEALEMMERLEQRLDGNAEPDNGSLSPRLQLWRLRAETLDNMACVHARLDGNAGEGILCHEQSIKIQKRMWKDHLNIGQNYYCMAMVYHNMGRKEEAMRAVFHALDIIERLCTQPCPTLIICYDIVATILYDCCGDREGALSYINKAWRVQERLKTRNILRFCLLFTQAKMVARSGDFVRAREMFAEGYRIALPILGKHLNTARALQSEGWAAVQVGNYPAALETLQRCLVMRRIAIGKMKWNVETAETLETMGDACTAQGQHVRATDYYKECHQALAIPIKHYKKIKAGKAEEVCGLREMIKTKMEIVSKEQPFWNEEEREFMKKTVIYEYNYWPMT